MTQGARHRLALVTGACGFAGSHLAEHLMAQGERVVGTRRPDDRPWPGGDAAPEMVDLELLEEGAILPLLRQVRPDAIYHLAAQSNIALSWKHPQETLQNNILAQTNLLEAVRAWRDEGGGEPTILIVGSADEYGRVEAEELPIRESQPLRPYSPYAVSKIAQDYLGYQYHVAWGLRIVRVRPFNHIGPRQHRSFVTQAFAKQLAEIERGLSEPVMRVGNLDVERDFSDVEDIVRGYRLAVLKGEPGEVYNLGSERATSVRSLLELLLSFTRNEVRIEREPERIRPVEVPVVVADCSRFRRLTGWRVEIDLEESLRRILDHWRAELDRPGAAQRGASGRGPRPGAAEPDYSEEKA